MVKENNPTIYSKMYSLFIESTRDYAIIMLDPNGIVSSWNAGAERINGYHAREIIGKHFSCFYTEEAKANNYPANELRVAISTGRYEEEAWRVRKDGTKFWANVIITALYDDQKELIGFGKITRDLTERKQAAEALRQSEDRLRAIVEGTKDYAILMLDPNGIVTTWNAGAEHINGYKPAEIIGKHFSCFYTEAAKAQQHPQYELSVAKKQGRYEEEGWRVRKDGTIFWANVIITALYDSQEQLIGFGKITRDLTERKKIEKLKSEFISIVSHELRTPLTSIQGALGLILTGALGNIPDKTLKFLNVAAKNCERLVRLINDILDIDKIEVGKMIFESRPFNLGELIQEAVTANQMYTKKYHVQMKIGNLLPNIIVNGDADRIMQALTNLISNAVKFSPPESSVEINMQLLDKIIRVSIRDYGPGIPEKFHDTIFEKFSQADTSNTRQKGGSGLGLAISKAIIENHHGSLKFANAPSTGSIFYFDLPIHSVNGNG